jgi:hypothetical protein
MSRRKRPPRRKAKRKNRRRRKSHPNGTTLLALDQKPFIRKALTAAKRNIAFAFSEADIDSLANEIRRDFKSIRRDLQHRMDWLQRIAEEFRTEAAYNNNPNQPNDENPFDILFDGISSSPPPSPANPQKTDARQMEFF